MSEPEVVIVLDKENPTPWDLIQPTDIGLMGEEILNETERVRWGLAFRAAGGLPYIWGVIARPLVHMIYGLLELKPGDRVLLMGESNEPPGWEREIKEFIGPEGELVSIDIQPEGRRRTEGKIPGRGGLVGTWQYEYVKDEADNSFDCIVNMQAVQHADDWQEFADDLHRVLKPGRRIVTAEAVNNGPLFHSRVNADVHLKEWYDKVMGDNVIRPDQIPYTSNVQIRDYFGDRMEDPQLFEWHGIEMYWGRKRA